MAVRSSGRSFPKDARDGSLGLGSSLARDRDVASRPPFVDLGKSRRSARAVPWRLIPLKPGSPTVATGCKIGKASARKWPSVCLPELIQAQKNAMIRVH